MSLYDDPRLSAAATARTKVPMGADLFTQALINGLGPEEMVERFLDSASPLGALTSQRVVVMTGVLSQRLKSVHRPYRTTTKKIPFMGHEVEVVGVSGESMKFVVSNADELATVVAGEQLTYGRAGAADSFAASSAAPGDGFFGDWRAAEEAAAVHMQLLGFKDARVTTGGADGGIDVVSHLAVAQVKDHAVPVGRPDIQKLIGAAEHRVIRVFYSTSGYSKQASDFARTAGVALFVLRGVGNADAMNTHAQRLTTGQQTTADDPVGNYFQGRKDKKEAEVAARIEFLSKTAHTLANMARPASGHPKRGIRKDALADIAACEKVLSDLQKARSTSRLMMERNSILKDAERKLRAIGKSRGVKPW